MSFCMKSLIILLSSALCFIVCSEILEGCSELVQKDTTKFVRLKLSDFDHNFPKSYEVFRLKLVYRGADFVFGINFNQTSNHMMFASYNESFGGFRSLKSYFDKTDPFTIRGSKADFDDSSLTPMEGVLSKGELYGWTLRLNLSYTLSDGVLSLFVYGEGGFTISGRTEYDFTNVTGDDLQILFGRRYIKSFDQSYYDCPQLS